MAKQTSLIKYSRLTLKQLVSRTFPEVRLRSKRVDILSGRKFRRDGVIVRMESRVQSNNSPVSHNCYIKSIPGKGEAPLASIGKGPVRVSCNCEYYLYNLEYVLARNGAADIIHSNGRPATVRNSSNRISLCKHLFKLSSPAIRLT